MKDDLDLLQAYLRDGSEPAFTEVVGRHKGMVYASALRQTGSPSLAEDITQAVFIVLARKAPCLKPGTILSGWLFRATRFAAADALKGERRRARREQQAAAMNPGDSAPLDSDPAAAWQEIAPVLDESLADLKEGERQALLLRFFERKTLADVGRTLGLSEEAARKRVDRALEKLKTLLGRRGVVVPALVLSAVLAANAAPAAPLALTVSTAVTTTGISQLVKATIGFMAWSKAKITALTIGALLLAGGGSVLTVSVLLRAHVRQQSASPAPADQIRAAQPVAAPEIPEQMVMGLPEEPAENPDGSIPLFNGHDLSGWSYNPNVWYVTNGVVTGRVAPEAGRTLHYLAWAGGEVDNFELRLSFRIGGNANSGVPLRARWAQRRWLPGYQAEIEGPRTGLLVIAGAGRERQLCRAGWRTIAREDNGQDVLDAVEPLSDASGIPEARKAVEQGQWCELTIIAEGTRFIIRLNGVPVVDTRDEHPAKFVPQGRLGLEYMHRQGVADFVEFRNLLFKRLPFENGRAAAQ